jgi:RNA polymerase sigma-70 factor (ECF subfamily)
LKGKVVALPIANMPDERVSGTEIVALPLRGDVRTRFRRLYDAEADFVFRNLRRLGITSDIEDRMQEVFVVAHRRFAEFEDRGFGPRAWLFQIVLRVASDARRHRRRHPEDADGGAAISRQSVDPEQPHLLAQREQLDRLDRALARMDMNRRAVLVLHEIEEMTAPAIAEILEVPLNTVYSRLRVARTELDVLFREGHELERRRAEGGERGRKP